MYTLTPLLAKRVNAVRRNALRLLWCLAGAGTGIATALLVGHATDPLLLASLGGSAVFLFGLTGAPAAQPRALLGGHLGGALIGIACYQLLGDSLWVYALAQVATLGYMLMARCIHPPAGANPLIMIHAHAGWTALVWPVLVSVVVLAAVAFVWSRLLAGPPHYPAGWATPSPAARFADWAEPR